MRLVTWHADTSESAAFVQASAVVLARIRVAFVDVDLASGAGESARAIAPERAGSVDAEAVVLARRTGLAFVDVFRTVDTFVAVRTRAHVGTIDGTCVTDGASVARIGSARIVQMAQQTSFTCCRGIQSIGLVRKDDIKYSLLH